MKNIKTLAGVFLLASLLLPAVTRAAFPGILQRYQLGYSFVMASADYEAHDKYSFTGVETDTTYKFKMNTKLAYGYTMGTYIPVTRLGRVSKLVVGVDYLYNILVWGSTVPRYGLGTGSTDIDFSGFTAQMALPVGLDFKWGCDALNVKNNKFCATVGFGAMPSYSLTALDFDVDIDPKLSVTPYAKLEAGVFAGICMKLRAVMSFGKFEYMDMKSSASGFGESSTKLTGTSNVTVSLLLMPFSFTWKKEEWWNTY